MQENPLGISCVSVSGRHTVDWTWRLRKRREAGRRRWGRRGQGDGLSWSMALVLLPQLHTQSASVTHTVCLSNTHSLPQLHTQSASVTHTVCLSYTHSLPQLHTVCFSYSATQLLDGGSMLTLNSQTCRTENSIVDILLCSACHDTCDSCRQIM